MNYAIILIHFSVTFFLVQVNGFSTKYNFHLNSSDVTEEIQKWKNLFRSRENFADLYRQAPNLLLNAHNLLRLKHWVPILKLRNDLNTLSQSWARQLAQERKVRFRPHNEYGENIYSENYETGLGYPVLFVHFWYAEVKNYKTELKYKDLDSISNFTQLIWKDSQYLGVGLATNYYNEVYVVCNYDPPGNIVQQFSRNIIEPVYDRSGDYDPHLCWNEAVRPFAHKYLIFVTIMYFTSVSWYHLIW